MAFSGSGRQGGGPSDGEEAIGRPLIGGRRPILDQHIKLNATQMHNLRMKVEYLVAVTKTRQRANGSHASHGTNTTAVGTPGMSAVAAEVAVAAVLAAAAARATANEAGGSGGNKQEAAVTTAPAAPEK